MRHQLLLAVSHDDEAQAWPEVGDDQSGERLVFSAGAAIVCAFDDNAGVTLVSGGMREHLDDDRAVTYGQGVLGVSLTAGQGFTLYVQGQADRGDGYRSVAGQLGVKFKF